MSQNNFSKKGILAFGLGLLASNVAASHIRNLQTDPNCNTYNDDNSCRKCSYRYYHNAQTGLCTKVSDFCQTWSNVTGRCLTCYEGYTGPINGQCDPGVSVSNPPYGFDPNCQCYNDNRTCNDCFEGYQLVNGICTDVNVGQPGDLCARYEYVDTKGKWHKKYMDGCKKVCVECVEGYYLDNNNMCKQLPEGCLTANQNGRCTQCEEGYNLVNGQCQVIVGEPVDPCAQYGYVNSYGKWYNHWFNGCKMLCKRCIEGYYLDSNYMCQELPENCLQANKNGQCTKCEGGYELVNGECQIIVTQPPPTDPCAEYGYVNAYGKWYKNWVAGCRKVCKQCIDGYYLDSNYTCQELPEGCITANQDGTCTECASGYQLIDGKCEVDVGEPPVDPCAQYGYLYQKKWYRQWVKGCKYVCKRCIEGYQLNDNYECQLIVTSPPPADDLCKMYDAYGNCVKCSHRSVLINGDCVQVSDQCATWSETTGKCKSCYDGYRLNNGECVRA